MKNNFEVIPDYYSHCLFWTSKSYSKQLAMYLALEGAYGMSQDVLFDDLTNLLGGNSDKLEFIFEDFTIDQCDWDGASLELKGTNDGFIPTEEQIQQIWDMGITVIRIDYKTAHTPSHGMSGDWHLVKGFETGKCHHTKKDESIDG